MHGTWSQDERNHILDEIRADLTADEILEIECLSGDELGRFIGRLFTALQAEFSG